MPLLSRVYIRTAALYFLAGFTAGALMLAHKGVFLHPIMWRLLPLHIEFLLFGWTFQFALGVAYWILPRFEGGASRGPEAPVWLAYALLNTGVVLIAIAGLRGGAPTLTLIGRVCELLAVVSFAVNAWPRVKPFRVDAHEGLVRK
ncbi:MAG: hypothetical protein D6802_01310 [Ardenticatenia bacterium]|nr:MAG: hypothetical protein D6802_01310 [Ardenticatenia bacterium]